jgi:hypothetical protein
MEYRLIFGMRSATTIQYYSNKYSPVNRVFDCCKVLTNRRLIFPEDAGYPFVGEKMVPMGFFLQPASHGIILYGLIQFAGAGKNVI